MDPMALGAPLGFAVVCQLAGTTALSIHQPRFFFQAFPFRDGGILRIQKSRRRPS